jgi:hypothetical protein
MQGLIERAGEILLHPDNEWAELRGEKTSSRDLLLRYAAPLAAIPAVAAFFGMTWVGFGGVESGYAKAMLHVLLRFAVDLAAVWGLAHLMVRLAPKFDAKVGFGPALQVAVYSFTPVWVAGVVGIVPAASLLVLAGYGYAAHVMAIGVQRLLGVGRDRALPFSGVCVAVVCVAVVVIHRLLSAALGGPAPL